MAPAGSTVIKLTSLNVLHTDMYFTYLDGFMVLLLIDFHFFDSHLCPIRAPFRNMAAILNLDKGCTFLQICSFLNIFQKGGGVKPMLKKYRFRNGILT